MAFQWLQMRIQEERERRELQAKHLARLPAALQEIHDLLAECVQSYTENFGANSADSGTSTACPVIAGCIAVLRTSERPTTTPPPALIAQLKATAWQAAPNGPGWNRDYGYGIVDLQAVAQSLGLA